MSELPDYVTRLVSKVAEDQGFTDYRIETAAGSKHGDGFMGVMVSATVIGNRKRNGKSHSDELHLLCKLMPSSLERRKEFSVDLLFEREVLVYNEVLPLLAKFQRDKGLSDDECFNAYPKCYAAVADAAKDEYALIMEDLRPLGYVMWPKAVSFDNAHAFAVMESLAKLHGASLALKNQRPDDFKKLSELRELLVDFFKSENIRMMFSQSYERAKSVLEDPKHIAIAEVLRVNMMGMVEQCVGSNTTDEYSVLCHGDCWINNILFRYEDEAKKQLKDVCLVDWQVIRHASPVLDLVYNIFNSTDKEFRRKEYQNLIAHYHCTLSAQIRRLGSDPDTLFPKTVLKQQLKKFGKFAFHMCPILIPMLVADDKDIPDMNEIAAKMASHNEDIGFALNYSNNTTEQKYKQRITDVFTDLVDLGYWAIE